MSTAGVSPELLALEGPPLARDLSTLMAADGLVLVLVGLRYPGNVGFILRAAEVAGAAGVVLAGDWQGSQREQAMRIGIRADRFLPLVEAEAQTALETARATGRRVLALETSGARAPWEIDFRSPAAVFVGGEAEGLPEALVDQADDVLRIPTRGFVPSYNVQAAVGIVIGEWLRQIDAARLR